MATMELACELPNHFFGLLCHLLSAVLRMNNARLPSLPALLLAAVAFAVASGAGEGNPFCAECTAADWPKTTTIEPREMGIDLPSGPIVKGKGETVTTLDGNSQPVVARVYVTIGENALLLLPDGQLVPRKKGNLLPAIASSNPSTARCWENA